MPMQQIALRQGLLPMFQEWAGLREGVLLLRVQKQARFGASPPAGAPHPGYNLQLHPEPMQQKILLVLRGRQQMWLALQVHQL